MTSYDPGRFSGTYEARNGSKIWDFLNLRETLIRMETATYLSRPAVEPLSPLLIQEFGEAVREDRIKQMIGHMVRQIMEHRGFAFDQSSVRIRTDGNIFGTGARYR